MFVWGDTPSETIFSGVATAFGSEFSVDKTIPRPLEGHLGNVTYISCNYQYMALITAKGELYTWGLGDMGRLGTGIKEVSFPTPVDFFDTHYVVGCSLGKYHMSAVTAGGQIFTWGSNLFGQLGQDKLPKSSKPVFVGIEDRLFLKVSSGKYHCAALYDYWFHSFSKYLNRTRSKRDISG